MAVISNNVSLTIGKLRALTLSGGDYAATISEGSDTNVAARGQHALIKYTAPLDIYYRNWHLRALNMYAAWVSGRKAVLLDMSTYISSVIGSIAASGVNNAHTTVMSSISQRMGEVSRGDPSMFAMQAALGEGRSRVIGTSVTADLARGQRAAEYTSIENARKFLVEFYQAAGKTSVDGLTSAIRSGTDVVGLQRADAAYNEELARFAEKQARAAEEDKAARRKAQGAILGGVISLAAKAALGGL